MYKRAIEALPDSLLLTFAYADFEATQGKSAAATEAFEALLVRSHLPCLLIRGSYTIGMIVSTLCYSRKHRRRRVLLDPEIGRGTDGPTFCVAILILAECHYSLMLLSIQRCMI